MAPCHPTLAQTYGERSEQPNLTPLATYLLRLMHHKQTNLCVSADVNTTSELLRVADEVGDHICILKTHADIIDDFGEKTIRGLNDLSRRKKFLVFEDRKFGDIGNTVQQQYTGGLYTISRWASIVNAHIFPGAEIITSLAQAAQKAIAAHNTSVSVEIRASPPPSRDGLVDDSEDDVDEDDDDDEDDADADDPLHSDADDSYFNDRMGRKHSVVSVSTTISMKSETLSPQPSLRPTNSQGSGADDSDSDSDPHLALESLGPPPYLRSLLLLAQMSSANNHFTPEYTAACVKAARSNRDFVMGFIAQQSLNERSDDNFISMAPGVQLAAGGDGKGQQYNTPRKVVAEAGIDVIIVGRGILAAHDRAKAALEYRRQGWAAYQERLRAAKKASR